MQTSTSVLAVCAIGFCAASISIAAPDNGAQSSPAPASRAVAAPVRLAQADSNAQLRDALRQKMTQGDTQEQTPSAAPASDAWVLPAQPARADDLATERAREAVRKKIAELEAQQKTTGTDARANREAVAAERKRAAAAEREARIEAAEARARQKAADKERAAAVAKARKEAAAAEEERAAAEARAKKAAAAEQKPVAAEVKTSEDVGKAMPTEAKPIKEAGGKVEQAPTAAGTGQVPAKMEMNRATEPTEVKAEKVEKATSPGFTPVEAPALPISATKEARLAELLKKYKADEITAEQYHKERASILAEP